MTRDLTIPLGYRDVMIRMPDQLLSEGDWAVLMAVLHAMRPALVEPDAADAHIAGPLELTPDEAIEVSLCLSEHVDRGGPRIMRGTDLAALAERLIAHEKDTDD